MATIFLMSMYQKVKLILDWWWRLIAEIGQIYTYTQNVKNKILSMYGYENNN